MSLSGTIIRDRYRLSRKVGRGGMGTVYQAFDTVLERDIAVKVLLEQYLSAEGVERLLQEARATASLNHPNIVAIHDAGTAGETPFIVMELVEGQSLRASPPADYEAMLGAARQILAALEHAHQKGIIHRDLKPENILITPAGRIKLVDFGLARSMASRITKEGGIAGTVFYLAPEMATGSQFDGRADLYSLGVILYEWTTGRLPFDAHDAIAVISQHIHAPVVPPRAHKDSIPAPLNALIVRLLNKSPDDRPASASDLLRILSKLDLSRDLTVADSVELSSLLDRVVRGRLVGRQEQLEEVRQLWIKAMTGQGQIVFISGEPGIGKSRLVLEMATQVEVSGYEVAVGECYPEAGLPYEPFQQIIRGQLEDHAGADLGVPDEVMADLAAMSPGFRISRTEISPNPPLDPLADRFRFYENVTVLLSTLAGRAPQLVVLEDLHWADSGTLGLLRHLARRTRDQPLMIVATYRASEAAADSGLSKLVQDLQSARSVSMISLPRLDKMQTQAMLEVIFGERISPEFGDGIYKQTEGNPFFVEEVCKFLIEEKLVVFQNGSWHRSPGAELAVPESVQLAVGSRIGVLSPETQEILAFASLFGQEFEFGSLSRASGRNEGDLIQALEEAERAQLINATGRKGKIRFSHHLLPLTLRSSIGSVRRSRLHLKVAAAVEADHPDNFEVLAFHYAQAGETRRACRYFVRAANRARDLSAMEDAAGLYSKALTLMEEPVPERFDMLAARAKIFDILADRKAQLADAIELVELAESLDDNIRRCDAQLALADVHLKTNHSLAREPAQKAVALARAAGDLAREGHALWRVGDQAHRRADLAASRSALETAAARFRRTRLPAEAATCLSILSVVLGKLGEEEAALRAAEEAVTLSRRSKDLTKEATSLRRLAIVHLDQIRFEQALPVAEEALRMHRAIGDRYEACNDLNALGILMVKMGRPEDGEVKLRESLDLAVELESKTARLYAINNLILYHYEMLGTYEAGLGFLNGFIEEAVLLSDLFSEGYLRFRAAQLLVRLGSFEQGLESVALVERAAKGLMGHQTQVQLLSLKGVLLARLGDFIQADEALREARAAAEMGGSDLDRVYPLTAGAELALMAGSSVELEDGLQQAEKAVNLLRGHKGSLLDAFGRALSSAARIHLALSKGNDVAAHRALSKTTELVGLAVHSPEVAAPEIYLYLHSQALAAVGQKEESEIFLERAHARVLLVRDQIEDRQHQNNWLQNLELNRQILAEWAAGHNLSEEGLQ